MGLRKMVAALVACLALAAVGASTAQAAWFIENVELGKAAKEDVQYEAMTAFTLTSTVGGVPLKITAQELECTPGVTCSIDGSNFGTDHSTGELTFTVVTVDQPADCDVTNEEIATQPLTDKVIMDPTGGAATFDEFFPETPPLLAEFELSGEMCPLDEFIGRLKGTLTGRTENTGVAILDQPITFNMAEKTTSRSTLTLGPAAATLTGEATATLSGAKAGKIFGATE